MIESTTFEAGERRYVSVGISSTNRSWFEVESASYILACGDEVESEGQCDIEQVKGNYTKISALIQPMRQNAIYRLAFKYTIYPEEYLYICKVRVV